MAIVRRIPQNYSYDIKEIITAIQGVLGNVPIHIDAKGFVKIDATVTGPQATALKTAILPLLTEVADITV